MKFGFLPFLVFFGWVNCQSQNLFLEECFIGGVTAAGRTSHGLLNGSFKIKWDSDYVLKDAYVFTYRYGRPVTKTFMVNDTQFAWEENSQIGEEQIDTENTEFFAVHGLQITDQITIENDSIHVYMNGHDHLPLHPNQGWWSLQFVFLYTSPSTTTPTCFRIYTASQKQTSAQLYFFQRPDFIENSDVGFSIYADRLGIYNDRSCIRINNVELGCVWSSDNTNPGAGGVRGHFYYENEKLFGLDDDTANTQVYKSDGIAVINNYLSNEPEQKIALNPVNVLINGYNLHPAFFIIYTPNCDIPIGEMPRSQTYCRRQSTPLGHADVSDTTNLSAIPNYDHYAWTPGKGLSDSTIANPQCFADSSRWYRVRMWNDDEGEACAQTIPVFVTANQVPRPGNLEVIPSICPANTGKIIFKNMAGKSPFLYSVNGAVKGTNTLEDLEPGNYDLSVTDAAGCAWDTTVVIPLNPIQTAAFTANPDSGYSPMKVTFLNQSELATDYTWLLDGVPFGNLNNKVHTFEEPGTYEVALVAHRLDELCADTAFAFIYVAQGLKLFIPNIITPNNDGRNDALVAQTGGVASMRWEVHNRWGNLLHSGEATRPPVELTLWSPEANGYPDGVYTVVITARGESGEVKDFVVQVSVVNG